MKLPPEYWCFARFAGKAPIFWLNSYAETSLSTKYQPSKGHLRAS
ncbi:hypothetical protein [Leptolyngbya sp. FACHB-16]|nr:hypothetical protein [Leptolyngbya sp. FACHB-16]